MRKVVSGSVVSNEITAPVRFACGPAVIRTASLMTKRTCSVRRPASKSSVASSGTGTAPPNGLALQLRGRRQRPSRSAVIRCQTLPRVDWKRAVPRQLQAVVRRRLSKNSAEDECNEVRTRDDYDRPDCQQIQAAGWRPRPAQDSCSQTRELKNREPPPYEKEKTPGPDSARRPTKRALSCRQGPPAPVTQSATVQCQRIPKVIWREALGGQLQRLARQHPLRQGP